MDMKKFTEKYLHSEELKDVPITYVFKVAFFIFELLKDESLYYESEEI